MAFMYKQALPYLAFDLSFAAAPIPYRKNKNLRPMPFFLFSHTINAYLVSLVCSFCLSTINYPYSKYASIPSAIPCTSLLW